MPAKRAELIVNIKRIDPFVAARNEYPNLGEQEKRCADILLAQPEKVIRLSISEFAALANTSQATAVRFARKLGFEGYPHLKLSTVASIGYQAGSFGQESQELELGINEKDGSSEVLQKLIADLNQAVTLVQRARVVATYGAGASNLVAKDCQLKFARLGKATINFEDNHQALSAIATLDAGDVLIVVSHSGATPEVLSVAEEFVANGVNLICITNDAKSPLAKLAAVSLRTQAERKSIRVGATVSRIAQLFIVDLLTISWAQLSWAQAKGASEAASEAVVRSNARKGGTENWSRVRPIPERVSTKSSINRRER
jgi:DNA-binding MurR/RpiR family transcriptional regulator